MRASPLVLSVVAAVLLAAPAEAATAFVPGSLDDALARARKERALVLVEVFATWCGPCKRQAADVFDAPEGTDLGKGMVAWRVDFDAPAQRALMERWNVLSLPTVLVLRPDGSEVDRIEGYDTKEAFLAEMKSLKAGKDPLPVLEKRLITTTDAGERMRLLVDIGHKKLVRGDPQGARLLERVLTEDTGAAGAAEEALFLLGRYHSRVKRDFATAKHVWRELLMRFPEGKYAGTAAWWYAGALHELGEDQLALGLLERRARLKPDESSLDALVSFAVEKGVGRDVATAVLNELEKHDRVDPVLLPPLRARLAAATSGTGT